MIEGTISARFKCEKCGARVVWPEDAVEDTKLICQDCGDDLGTYGDLHRQGMEAGRAEIKRRLKGILERR